MVVGTLSLATDTPREESLLNREQEVVGHACSQVPPTAEGRRYVGVGCLTWLMDLTFGSLVSVGLDARPPSLKCPPVIDREFPDTLLDIVGLKC